MTLNTKIIYTILQRHGPQTSSQILKHFPEAKNIRKLKGELLHHLRRSELLQLKRYAPDNDPSKQIFFWTLPGTKRKEVELAGKKLLESGMAGEELGEMDAVLTEEQKVGQNLEEQRFGGQRDELRV